MNDIYENVQVCNYYHLIFFNYKDKDGKDAISSTNVFGQVHVLLPLSQTCIFNIFYLKAFFQHIPDSFVF